MIEVVAAVVYVEGRILCVKRGASKYPYLANRFEFPGGKIEKGESPKDALRRELIEELDYEVDIDQLFVTIDHSYPDFTVRLHFYKCKGSTFSINLKEHISYEWLLPHELKCLDWAPADYPLLKMLENNSCHL